MIKKLFYLLVCLYSFPTIGQTSYPFENVKGNDDLLAYWYNIPTDSMYLKMMKQTFHFYSTLEVYGKSNQDSFQLKIEVYEGSSGKVFDKVFFIKNKKTDENCQLSFNNDCFKLVYPVKYLERAPDKILLTITDSNGQRKKEILCRYHKLYGNVYDFDGKPFRAFISVRPDDFDFKTTVWSDSLGYYEIELPERVYNDIAVVNEDYFTKVAEAWAWHIIMDTDQRMDFKIGNGEVYNLNVWPNNGGGSTYFVSFRPMSISVPNSKESKPIFINDRNFNLLNISPDIKMDDIKVYINTKECNILSIQEYFETSDSTAIKAYLLQVDKKGFSINGKQNLLVEYKVHMEMEGKEVVHSAIGYFQFFTNFSGLSNYY
jgi:hypothetical protein